MKILNDKGEEVKEINLAEIEAGEVKEYSYYLFNDTEAEIYDIQIELIASSKEYKKSLEEITISSIPKSIAPDSKDKIKIKWASTLSIKKGIKADIKISSKELYS